MFAGRQHFAQYLAEGVFRRNLPPPYRFQVPVEPLHSCFCIFLRQTPLSLSEGALAWYGKLREPTSQASSWTPGRRVQRANKVGLKTIKPVLLCLALLAVIALGARYLTDSHGPPIPADGWESVHVFGMPGEKRQFPPADPRAFADFLRQRSSGWREYPPKGPFAAASH